MRNGQFFCFVLLFCFLFSKGNYKPVVLVHGILSNGGQLFKLAEKIRVAHPGTCAVVVQYTKSKLHTFGPLDNQLDKLINLVKPIMKNNVAGIHLICHSQGK